MSLSIGKRVLFEDSREEREKDRVDSPGRPLIELCLLLMALRSERRNRPNFWQKFEKNGKFAVGFSINMIFARPYSVN
jgi:hypothetical protein